MVLTYFRIKHHTDYFQLKKKENSESSNILLKLNRNCVYSTVVRYLNGLVSRRVAKRYNITVTQSGRIRTHKLQT